MHRVAEDERTRRTILDTRSSHFLQALGNRTLKGRRYSDVEAATDESKSERFAGLLGELDTNAAENALAGFVNDFAMLKMLLEGSAVFTKSIGIGAVGGGIFLERTITRRTAIAMQTACRFGGSVWRWNTGAPLAGKLVARRCIGMGK